MVQPYGPTFTNQLPKLRNNPGVYLMECKTLQEAVTALRQINGGLMLLHLNDQKSFINILQLMKLVKPLMKKDLLRVVVTTKLTQGPIIQKLQKFLVTDIVNEPVNARALGFKLDRHIKIMEPKYRKKGDDSSGGGMGSKKGQGPGGKKDDRRKKGELKYGPPIEDLESDCWLINAGGAKTVLGRWMIDLMGPGPVTGRWVESKQKTKGTDQFWEWQPNDTENDKFIKDDGKWIFRGHRPEFRNSLWSFVGKAPELQFISEYAPDRPYFKFKTEPNGDLTMSKDSKNALRLVPEIEKSIDNIKTFEKDAKKGKSLEFEDKEEEKKGAKDFVDKKDEEGGDIKDKRKEDDDEDNAYGFGKKKKKEDGKEDGGINNKLGEESEKKKSKWGSGEKDDEDDDEEDEWGNKVSKKKDKKKEINDKTGEEEEEKDEWGNKVSKEKDKKKGINDKTGDGEEEESEWGDKTSKKEEKKKGPNNKLGEEEDEEDEWGNKVSKKEDKKKGPNDKTGDGEEEESEWGDKTSKKEDKKKGPNNKLGEEEDEEDEWGDKTSKKEEKKKGPNNKLGEEEDEEDEWGDKTSKKEDEKKAPNNKLGKEDKDAPKWGKKGSEEEEKKRDSEGKDSDSKEDKKSPFGKKTEDGDEDDKKDGKKESPFGKPDDAKKNEKKKDAEGAKKDGKAKDEEDEDDAPPEWKDRQEKQKEKKQKWHNTVKTEHFGMQEGKPGQRVNDVNGRKVYRYPKSDLVYEGKFEFVGLINDEKGFVFVPEDLETGKISSVDEINPYWTYVGKVFPRIADNQAEWIFYDLEPECWGNFEDLHPKAKKYLLARANGKTPKLEEHVPPGLRNKKEPEFEDQENIFRYPISHFDSEMGSWEYIPGEKSAKRWFVYITKEIDSGQCENIESLDRYWYWGGVEDPRLNPEETEWLFFDFEPSEEKNFKKLRQSIQEYLKNRIPGVDSDEDQDLISGDKYDGVDDEDQEFEDQDKFEGDEDQEHEEDDGQFEDQKDDALDEDAEGADDEATDDGDDFSDDEEEAEAKKNQEEEEGSEGEEDDEQLDHESSDEDSEGKKKSEDGETDGEEGSSEDGDEGGSGEQDSDSSDDSGGSKKNEDGTGEDSDEASGDSDGSDEDEGSGDSGDSSGKKKKNSDDTSGEDGETEDDSDGRSADGDEEGDSDSDGQKKSAKKGDEGDDADDVDDDQGESQGGEGALDEDGKPKRSASGEEGEEDVGDEGSGEESKKLREAIEEEIKEELDERSKTEDGELREEIHEALDDAEEAAIAVEKRLKELGERRAKKKDIDPPQLIAAEHPPGPSLSPLAISFLVGELMIRRKTTKRYLAKRYCEYVTASCGGLRTELWVKRGEQWICAGTPDGAEGQHREEVEDYAKGNKVRGARLVSENAFATSVGNGEGIVVVKGPGTELMSPDYLVAVANVTVGMVATFVKQGMDEEDQAA